MTIQISSILLIFPLRIFFCANAADQARLSAVACIRLVEQAPFDICVYHLAHVRKEKGSPCGSATEEARLIGRQIDNHWILEQRPVFWRTFRNGLDQGSVR